MNNLNPRFKTLFETSHLQILLLNSEGRVQLFNPSFAETFAEAFSRLPTQDLLWELPLWGRKKEEIVNAWEHVQTGNKVNFIHPLFIGHEVSFFQVSMLPVIDDGKVVEVVLELINVDELEKNKSALTESRLLEHKQKKLVAKLAGIISHDLRAPIANTSYLLSMLKNQHLTDDLQQMVNALKESTAQALQIIDQLGEGMNIRMKGNGKVENVALRKRIDEVLEQFEEEVRQTRARIIVDIYDTGDWKLPGGAFQMILGQIISNSLKFRKPEESPKIIITCYRKNGDRIVEVKDNGLGLNVEENRGRIFGLFQTFHPHPDSRGVGLFQVKNRINALGGDVSLDSQKGMGTTVTLNFKKNEFEETPLHY